MSWRFSFFVPGFALLAAAAGPALSICPPFPCTDCWIRSQGQLNLVVIDRDAGMVRLVPNLNFAGPSPDYALVVPTPALPSLEEASTRIWDDAFMLTAPIFSGRRGDSSPFGCSDEDVVFSTAPPGSFDTEADDQRGVTVHSRENVGAFEATIISSDDPTALVDWLRDNGFVIEDDDAEKFAPLVERQWYFTAMKPDTTDPLNQMPVGGWNNDVNPVLFEYEGTGFELPLGILSINRAGTFPVVMFVVDDHRMTFEGFQTIYANHLRASEVRAIGERFPSLIPFVSEGRFMTRLDRIFEPDSPMEGFLELTRAPGDAEFRRTSGVFLGGVPLELGLLALLAARPLRRIRRRRRSTA